MAVIAVGAILGQRGELAGAGSYLARVNPLWAIPTTLVEAVSTLAFARVQARLLRAGGVRPGAGWIVSITLAAASVSNSLPGGPAFASVYAYRQYRWRGADETLAAWTAAFSGILAVLSLAVLAAAGVAVAWRQGPALDVSAAVLGVLLGVLALAFLLHRHGALLAVAVQAVRLGQRVVHRPRGDAEAALRRLTERLVAIRPGKRDLLAAFGWGLGNWAFDCGCLAIAFAAVGVGVPWRALLLAYGVGQLAANLPITPGGLGVVEGSLTIALVAYGGATSSTVAAVLLYRIFSFWLPLLVGWLAFGGIALAERASTPPARSAGRA